MSLCIELTGLGSFRNIDQSSWNRDIALQSYSLIDPSPTAAASFFFLLPFPYSFHHQRLLQKAVTLREITQLTVLVQ